MPDFSQSERPGAREAIDRCAKQWAKDGMDPEKAKRLAREKALEHDRKNPHR